MNITKDELINAFNEIQAEVEEKHKNEESWEFPLSYRCYPSEQYYTFEILINCSVPDKPVAIGSIIINWENQELFINQLTYVGTEEITISDWDLDEIEELTVKDLLLQVISSIYDDINRIITFEEHVAKCIEDAFINGES